MTGWLCFLCFIEFFHFGTYARCFCWMVLVNVFESVSFFFRNDCFARFAIFRFFLFVPGCFAQIAWFCCIFWVFWFVLLGPWCWMPSPGSFRIFASYNSCNNYLNQLADLQVCFSKNVLIQIVSFVGSANVSSVHEVTALVLVIHRIIESFNNMWRYNSVQPPNQSIPVETHTNGLDWCHC